MQQEAIKIIEGNANTVILSPTGTGKTLAFLLPLLSHIDTNRDTVQALILSPTRELALQTGDVLSRMKTPVRHLCLYGGRPAMEEHRRLRDVRPQVVVATPGRLLDHIRKGNLLPQGITTAVVDEYDKMQELKFMGEVESVFEALTGLKRCVLVSATAGADFCSFVGFRGHRPAILNDLDTTAAGIRHLLVRSPEKDKLRTLDALLRSTGEGQTVVFVNYRESAERVCAYLRQEGHSAVLFHGGLEQRDRERALALFLSGSACALVSTDLSSRGIDVPTLDNVVHYHLPLTAEGYIHRCGRTGRWQRGGRSFVILSPDENAPDINGVRFEEYALPAALPAPAKPQWETLYIGRGRRDKLSKGDVVGFLCKKGGISVDDIGRIQLEAHCVFAAVRRRVVNSLLRNTAGEKIKKMSTKIEPVRK